MSHIDAEDRVARDRLANGGPVPFTGSGKAFMKRLQLETWVALRHFFKGRNFHAGGSIPQSLLLTQQNFNRVVSTDFAEGIDLCYKLLKECNIRSPIGFDQEKFGDWDVYYIVSLLGEVQRCHIPPYLQAGVMVLYFKICQGVKVSDIELDITHLIT